MEVWDGSVALGYIVRAESVYAPLFIRAIRFGMGASGIASGRKPTMDKISTRCAGGAGVGVMVNVGVNVNVGVTVIVAVLDGVDVAGCILMPPGIWQAKSNKRTRINGMRLRLFIRLPVIKIAAIRRFLYV